MIISGSIFNRSYHTYKNSPNTHAHQSRLKFIIVINFTSILSHRHVSYRYLLFHSTPHTPYI